MKKMLIKTLILCLSIILICGCSTQEQTLSIVTDLDKSLNKLETIVNNLDIIDNNYIANPDLYIKQINNATTSKEPDNSLNKVINDAIIEIIEDKLNKNNNDCCNNNCNSGNCEKNILDNNFNKNLNTNETTQFYCPDGSCTNQNFQPKSSCSNPSPYPSSKKINSDEEKIKSNIDDLVFHYNNKDNTIKNIPFESDSMDSSSIELLEENLPKQSITSKKIYEYTDDDFTPDNLRYNPRYKTKYDSNNASNQLNNYINKIQKLYAVSEDVLEANNVLKIYKTNLIDLIKHAKEKNNELKKYSNQTSSVQKIQAIRNYISDLNITTGRLKACNGQLNNEISNINSSNTSSISSSIDVINSNYIKILNHIDTRINYHENAIATINQLNYLLDDLILELINSDSAIESNIDSYNNNQLSNISNTEKNANIVDNNLPQNQRSYIYDSNNTQSIDQPQDRNNVNNYNENQDYSFNDNNNNLLNPNLNDGLNYNNSNDAEYYSPYYYQNENSNFNNNNSNYGVSNNTINSLINQNNLNTDNNRDLYYYENNGSLKNAKNNEYLLNNKTNNTNIDTYNYNTLVDSINRGTIDNGINRLSIQTNANDKPIMVSDDRNSDFSEENMNEENNKKLKELSLELNRELSPNSSNFSDELDENNNDSDKLDNSDNGKKSENIDQPPQPEKNGNKVDLNYNNNNIEEPSIEFIEDENINESDEE